MLVSKITAQTSLRHSDLTRQLCCQQMSTVIILIYTRCFSFVFALDNFLVEFNMFGVKITA